MKSFSELSGKAKAVELLRWALVPCVAVLAGYVIPRIIANFLMPPPLAQPPGTPRVPPSDFQRIYLAWIAPILMGVAFVIAGAKTAPRRRSATAIVLAGLWMLYSFRWELLVHPVRDIRHYARFLVAMLAAASGVASIACSEKTNRPR